MPFAANQSNSPASNATVKAAKCAPVKSAKKHPMKPDKENVAKARQKVPDASVKSDQVHCETKGLIHQGIEAEKKKIANDTPPVQPIMQPSCPSPPPVKPANPVVRGLGTTTTTAKAQGTGKPAQKKIHDFFKPIVRRPHPSTPPASAIGSAGASTEVEVRMLEEKK